jgi:hypothetical protein
MSELTTPPNRDDRAAFRELSASERQLFDAFLAQNFPGRAELVDQLQSAKVRPVDNNPSLDISVDSGAPAIVDRRIPIEAEVEDSDGVIVHILLHVVDGFMNELEIYRDDSRPLKGPIDQGRLRFLIL